MLIHYQDRRLLAAMRLYQSCRDRSGIGARLGRSVGKLRHALWTILSASDIHRDATIDYNAQFPHLRGVVIHQDAVVEAGCMIMQGVTLGQTGSSGAPVVRSGAYIGAGAKVLGRITIGRNARIGANAVVLTDVPDNATAVGVPARIIAPGEKGVS